jgi:surface protein
MGRVLYASVPLGSQAFSSASAFNADIGAWNTASVTSMASVCALCHRLCVGRVCGLRRLVWMPSALADRACGRACLLVCVTHFSRNICALVRSRNISPGFCQPQLPQLRRISMIERQHIAPHALGH